MTISVADMGLYAGALFVLFLTPGPVWLALMARSMTGGFPAAWPLALGVAVGDVVWSVLAILGVSWIVGTFQGFMEVLRYGACAVFLVLGWSVINHADEGIRENRHLTRPGKMAGFLAGVAVILGNPKAILFYMGLLPGFFDLGALTGSDIAVIVTLSLAVPLLGNLMFAVFIDRMRQLVTSARTLKRVNLVAGWLLVCVGLLIPFI